MTVELLGWPMIPGSPMGLAQAHINLTMAVHFSVGDYPAARDEYVAAQQRHRERGQRLAARRTAMIRAIPALSGAEHELAYYGGVR